MEDGDDNSDSYSEGDIVYYHKDDMTKFSEGLDLNKIKRLRGKRKVRPLSDMDEIVEDNRTEHSGEVPFRTTLSDVEQASTLKGWDMRYRGSHPDNFRDGNHNRSKSR